MEDNDEEEFRIVSSPFIYNVIRNVENKICTEVKPYVKRRVFAYEGDMKSLLNSELKRFENEGVGIFCCVIHNGYKESTAKFGEVINFRHGCERWYKPRGKAAYIPANDLPMSTRANDCCAYVSHQFFQIKNIQICVQRVNPVHKNHNVNDVSQYRKSRICPELTEQIDEWFGANLKKNDIRDRCLAWAKARGHFDTNDRRYYPSIIDIKTLYVKYKKNLERAQRPPKICRVTGPGRNRVGKHNYCRGGGKSLIEMEEEAMEDVKPTIIIRPRTVNQQKQTETVKLSIVNNQNHEESDEEDDDDEEEMPRNHVLFCQETSKKSTSTRLPVLLVLQTDWQQEQMIKYGNDIVFMLTTYTDGNVLYIVVVRDDSGEAIPVCYAFMSEETEQSVGRFLDSLQANLEKSDFYWHPQTFVVDKNTILINVLKRLFDNQIPILLCWFHVLKAILHWTMKEESGLRHSRDVRANLFRFLSSAKSCSTETEFDTLWDINVSKFSLNIGQYLNENWKRHGSLWANFGRKFFLNSDENDEIERYFDHIKYQLLNCLAKRPLDGIMDLLMEDYLSDYQTLDLLIQAAYIKQKEDANLQLAYVNANEMIESGWDKKIRWMFDCHLVAVPSQSSPDISYYVNLVDMWCTCRQNGRGLKCEHMLVVEICAENETFECPSGEEMRENEAQSLFTKQNYEIIDDRFMLIANDVNGFSSVVDLAAKNCNCVASSFGLECVCLKMLQKWQETNSSNVVDFSSPSSSSIINRFESEKKNNLRQISSPASASFSTKQIETQQMLEELLEKIDSGWEPSDKFTNDLKKLHYSVIGCSNEQTPQTKRRKLL